MTKNRDISKILDQNSVFTAAISVGSGTVNVYANSSIIKLANSTVNTALRVPTPAQYTGSYYLHANGDWALVSAGATPGGLDSYVQYNDGGSTLGGIAGFTFNDGTNNVFIANTLTVGTATVNSTLAAVAALNVTNQVNTGTFFATTSANVGANVQLSTIRLLIGNATANLNANSILVSLANSTGIANLQPTQLVIGTSTVNTTAHAAGANVIVTTSGLTLGNSTVNLIANSNLITISNTFGTANLQPTQLVIGTSTVSPLLFAAGANVILDTVKLSIGETATFTANDTLVNAAAINITGRVNTATLYATTSANVGGNVQITTSTATVSNGGATQVSIAATGVTIANTGNTVTIVPPSTAQKGGSFYLKADGSWASVAASAGGSDTQVQFNDGGTAFGGSAGFTFAKASNNVAIANTLTVGTATVNSTLGVLAALNVTNQVNTATFFATTSANVGANVQANTIAFRVGNSAVNTVASNDSIYIGNSTANSIHNSSSYAVGAINTTSVGSLQTNSTITIGNSSVNSIINSTTFNATANNALNLGGTAAASYQLNSTLAANVATMNANNATWLGTSISANSTGAYPTSNTVGAVLGNTLSRVIITGNSATFSSTLAATDTTITGFVNATVSVNSAAHTIGTTFIANTLGVYHTGIMNAASHTTSGITANTLGVYPSSNTVGTALGTTTNRWILTANTIESTGLANVNALNVVNQTNTATLLSTGLANLNALNVTNQTNTATLYATTSANVGGNVQITTSTATVSNGGATQVSIAATGVTIANTGNTVTIVPPSTAQKAGSYYLKADGVWTLVSAGATPGGLDSYIQYNDGGSTLNGIAGFTLNDTTNNVNLANTLFLGGATVNLVANAVGIKISNSTVNTALTLPTSGQYSATNYFLHANGSWVQLVGGSGSVRVYERFVATGGQVTFTVAGGYTINQIEVFHNGIHLANNEYTQDASTVVLSEAALVGATIEVAGWIQLSSFSPIASGSNTQVQFNDSTLFAGNPGFTFDKTNNNAFIANTLTIGSATINSTNYSQTANNALSLAGTAAASYQLNSTLAANVATMTSNNATWHGTSISANSTGAYPTSNSVGAVYGNTLSRVIIVGNSATFSSTLAATDTTITGFVNATVSVNSAAHTIGSTFIANTLGVYHTGLMNAASFNTTGFTANTTGVFPASNTVGDDFGTATQRWVMIANSVTVSNGLFPDSNTVGTNLGDATHRWNLTGNTSSLAGGLTAATVNAATSVNSALITVGTAFVANTLGAYHTGLMNAASYNATGYVANTTGVYHTGLINAASYNATGYVANTTGVYHTGLVNAASFNVGTSTIVNSTMVSVTAGSLLSANIQVNPQTGTTYTLAATDSGKIVTMNNAGSMTVTLPAGLPIGFRCQVLRLGAGTCTMSNTGQTSCNMLSRTGTFAITAQYGSISVFQTATANTYIVDGLL